MPAQINNNHEHSHGKQCGHVALEHNGHIDYLHDGHLHHPIKDGIVEEHTLAVTKINAAQCNGGHVCNGHDVNHIHGPNCGHESVPHGDHHDYLVNGHLHYQHNGHCDNHGPVKYAL
jgi:hypothetical protein